MKGSAKCFLTGGGNQVKKENIIIPETGYEEHHKFPK